MVDERDLKKWINYRIYSKPSRRDNAVLSGAEEFVSFDLLFEFLVECRLHYANHFLRNSRG